jgi:DNA-binding transcriptional LysR family regulator
MNEHKKSSRSADLSSASGASENWDEIRIAYHVARLGTLSAAAKYLGIHHATVIRHIDALEARLGSKLFQRNPRGYNPTEAGIELMQVAATTDELLGQLSGNLKGRSEAVSGDLIVTTLGGLSPQVTPLLVEFGRQYRDVRLSLVVDERTLQLEYGEAHVALRAGAKPQEPNNVVQPVARFPSTLFAHKDYIKKYGPLLGEADAANHRFIGRIRASRRVPFQAWMQKNVPDKCIVYRVSDMRSFEDAVLEGAGIGFLSLWSGNSNPDLVQMMSPLPEWESQLWLVTHMDLHRTAKVQALASFLKERLVSKLQFLQHQQARDPGS